MLKAVQEYRARRLSNRGEYAKALLLADFQEPSVLLKAGMYLTAKKVAVKSLHKAEIAVRENSFKDAFFWIEKCIEESGFSPEVVNVLSRLASSRPIDSLNLLESQSVREQEKSSSLNKLKAFLYRNTDYLNKPELLLESLICSLNTNFELGYKPLAEQYSLWGLAPPPLNVFSDETEEQTLNSHQEYIRANKLEVSDARKVSVIMCVYNEERYLLKAMSSVLQQTWSNLELILIDDNSTDRTLALAQKIRNIDSRVRIIKNPVNMGLWKSKNLGLEDARGDFFTWHDGDDWSHQNKLELQLEPLFKNENLMSTSSYLIRYSEHSKTLFSRNIQQFVTYNPSSFLARKKCVPQVGNFLTDILGADFEYINRFQLYYGASSHYAVRLPLMVAFHRLHSLSNKYRDDASVNKRLDDWERWRRLHVKLIMKGKNIPFLDKSLEFIEGISL